ncbi:MULTISPECIES: TetR/AcrR family transcriptional regulator [Caldimonas]|uniref:TetR/AcrR family transcriptional regulator n=2 Tax=Sphaerotilaceae TaxID=2975441 RepID=UPI001E4DC3D2|nr:MULTISPECIES: TetR/AcrR family transcriptional regulator [Caldimonas]MCX7660543.1 TetR family transcriptional regulator [Caldimonas manganoxidans]
MSAHATMNETVRASALAASKRTRKAAAAPRTNDPERTMQDILEVATREFAAKGLTGARIDEIAELTRTSKRMIYYYFGSKEGLYVAVLEEAYRRIRQIEGELHLEDLPPEEALRTLVAFTFDYQNANPDFIRLVMNENIHRGEFLAQSQTIQQLNVPAIDAVRAVYERGRAAGVFRDDLDPVDLHMSISALCFFNVSNRYTFSLIFKRDMASPEALAARRASIVDLIVRYVRK